MASDVAAATPPEQALPGSGARNSMVLEYALRVIACAAEFPFVRAFAVAYWADPYRITVLLLLIQELWTFGVLMLARPARARDMHPLVVVTMPYVFGYVILLDPSPGHHIVPEWLGVTMQVVGLCAGIYAKISLGRSFGLLPANRGIVASGAFRWIRHPIYASYLLSHLGFLLSNFHLRNLLTLGALYALQLYRIFREERLLSASEEYRRYMSIVRYRLIPGLF